ncbi:MAG: putative IMPACT (imprinted ancient) family translation regulator [Crocinitomicaceae bacterium]|jgi:putative IMPACT (imprinted ancient) family translation regulator
MSTKTLPMDLGGNNQPKEEFQNYEKIINDRRSVYSVSIIKVHDKKGIKAFLKRTKKIKNHDKATHHSWAVRISNNGVIYESKNDGGETGAGQVILRILQKKHMIDTIVCVTRWYGGIKLEADRFRHVQDATFYALNQVIR